MVHVSTGGTSPQQPYTRTFIGLNRISAPGKLCTPKKAPFGTQSFFVGGDQLNQEHNSSRRRALALITHYTNTRQNFVSTPFRLLGTNIFLEHYTASASFDYKNRNFQSRRQPQYLPGTAAVELHQQCANLQPTGYGTITIKTFGTDFA